MKIISYLIVASILIGLTVTSSTENTVESVSSVEGQINLNSGILGSISKYKLKNKGKAKSKNKSLNKAKSASTVSAKTSEEASNKALTNAVQAAALAAPVPAAGVNTLSGGKPSSQGNTNMPLKAGPKLWEGWVKFYIYKTTDEKSLLKGTQQTKFFKNYDFYEQFKKDASLNVDEIVDKEFKNIHDPYSFYVSLFPNNINFSNSRKVSTILK